MSCALRKTTLEIGSHDELLKQRGSIYAKLWHKQAGDGPAAEEGEVEAHHEEAHRDVKFALAVQAFPHYCAVCAMWVYIGIVIPHKSKKDKEKEEEEEKKKRRAEAKVNVKGSLQANQ